MQVQENVYDKNLELLRRFRDGDGDAGDELAELNKPLIYSIVARFRGRGADFEELAEAGSIGFVKAVNTFDFDRGCAFSTYATPLIFGEIRRFLRDDGMIKVSREEKRLSALLCAERERRIAAGEEADVASVAAAVGISVQDASSALCAASPVRSLEEAAFDDDDSTTLGSTLCDEDAEIRQFDRFALRMAIEKLSESQKKLIILRYFRDLSQTETAKILGLTQVKVSREEKKIMEILRRELS